MKFSSDSVSVCSLEFTDIDSKEGAVQIVQTQARWECTSGSTTQTRALTGAHVGSQAIQEYKRELFVGRKYESEYQSEHKRYGSTSEMEAVVGE